MLARAGHAVTDFPENAAPLVGASRWNAGRLHRSHVCGAESTRNTARRFIPAAMRFRPIMNELLGQDITPECTTTDDTCLVHRRSVIAPDLLEANLHRIDGWSGRIRTRTAASRPCRARGSRGWTGRRSKRSRIRRTLSQGRVPERSVGTQWLCDRLAEVLPSTPGLDLRPGEAVASAPPVDLPGGRWEVALANGRRDVFDSVASASWNGLLEIDRTAGLALDFAWSHRLRPSIFATTAAPVPVDSMFVAVGPFGFLRNHHGRKFYVSWYETGLRTCTEDVKAIRDPPPWKLRLDRHGQVRDRALHRGRRRALRARRGEPPARGGLMATMRSRLRSGEKLRIVAGLAGIGAARTVRGTWTWIGRKLAAARRIVSSRRRRRLR